MDVVDAARDLATVELGDARRNKRARMLAARLQERPDASFPELFGASELEAHYRFTNSESVTLKKLISPHLQRSWEQTSDATCVLVVHDTTELSFPGESPREGLVFTGGRSYCHLHASLLLADERAPVVLGLAGLRPYVVQGEVWREVDGRALTPLKCGSDRWRDAAAAARADAPVGPRLVHLMDREADDYPLWAYIVKLGDGFVIRSGQPQRRTAGGGAVGGHLENIPAILGREVFVSRRSKTRPTKDKKRHPPRDARSARLEVRAAAVEILRPLRPGEAGLPERLSLNIVEVVEVDTPEGEAPITWRLVTTLPVSSGEEVERVVDFYRKRWIIEEYFKALKTGCALEERQAESRHALLNTLGLLAPVAVGLLQLRVLARHEPDRSAAGPLTGVQLRVLSAALGKALPKRPTNRDVMLAVAKLGGHLKSNGDPGWQVLGRGFVKLRVLTEGWEAAVEQLGWKAKEQRSDFEK